MHFDLTDLRLFAAIAECGSITAGAERVGLALASASARVRGMETALGAPLLERGRRGVRPTPAGQTLLHHARRVLEEMERLRGGLRDHARGGLRGHVRLLSNTAAIEEHLPAALAGWLAANPGIDLDLEERLSQEIAAAIAQGEAAAGILSGEAGTGGLEAHPFRIDRLVVVAPHGHALAERPLLRFAEVLEEDFVGLPAGNALSAHLSQQAARLGHVPRFRVRLRGVTALARMVEAGVGIAVLPEVVARRCQREMALAAIPLADPWALRRLMLCVRRLDALPVHARRLVEHLIATGPEEIPAAGHGAA